MRVVIKRFCRDWDSVYGQSVSPSPSLRGLANLDSFFNGGQLISDLTGQNELI